MAEYDDTIIHEADGIQEMDNKLPRWWVLLFQLTTVFAVLYMLWFHVFDIGSGQIGKYTQEVGRAEAAQAALAAQQAPMDLSAPSLDSNVIATGQTIYTTHCVACHTSSAGGLIGPNLTDAYWLHGASFDENMTVIANGVLEKGMQAWKTMLSERQRYAVASYLYTLRGSQPANPKAPEGVEIPGSDNPKYLLGAE
jgi:cytochrome c oxidase cbb3-type subunit III